MSKDNDNSIYDNIQFEALAHCYLNTNEFFERKVRRWFSTTFYTPLQEVFDLPWEFVLQHYFEYRAESLEKDKLMETIKENFLPELTQREEKEDEEFARQIAEQEKKRDKEKPNIKQPQEEPIEENQKSPLDRPIINMDKINEIANTTPKPQSLNKVVPQPINLKWDKVD